MAVRKKSDVVQLSKIRMREELRRKLVREAEKNKTTLNGQIVALLEFSLMDQELRARDTEILDILAGGGGTAGSTLLLREFVLLLQTNPQWNRTAAGVEKLVKRATELIRQEGAPWLKAQKEIDNERSS